MASLLLAQTNKQTNKLGCSILVSQREWVRGCQEKIQTWLRADSSKTPPMQVSHAGGWELRKWQAHGNGVLRAALAFKLLLRLDPRARHLRAALSTCSLPWTSDRGSRYLGGKQVLGSGLGGSVSQLSIQGMVPQGALESPEVKWGMGLHRTMSLTR